MYAFQFKHEFNGLPVYIFADDYPEAIAKLTKMKLPKFNVDHWELVEIIEDEIGLDLED